MADTEEQDVEQTLHIARAVSVYRIPPRPGASGWRSGEWLVSDKLFSGRLRMVAKGELCEIRLEDQSSGELFVMCPVHYGQRIVCVEPVTDSSRYYVLRVEDSATRRHAFLGMGFDNRTDAFDFSEALVRHEQQVARERAARGRVSGVAAPGSSSSTTNGSNGAAVCTAGASGSASGSGPQCWAPGAAAASSTAAAEMEGLYRQTAGLRLQEGQTIRVNVSGLRKSTGTSAAAAGGGNFFSGVSSAQLSGRIGAIPPPPVQPIAALRPPALPPPAAPPQPLADAPGQLSSQQGATSLLSDGSRANGRSSVVFAAGNSVPNGGTQEIKTDACITGLDNWATFD